MEKTCQKCGKKFEIQDFNDNFCADCKYQEEKWDEYFRQLENKQTIYNEEIFNYD